jgi:predicted O-methyltransferase YrrM
MTFPFPIENEKTFRIDEIEFHIDNSPTDRRLSKPRSFTIVKSRPYLAFYGGLSRRIAPRSILELGIFQGGSFVLLDKLFKPRRIAALDHRPDPVGPLMEYVKGLEHRYANFGVRQSDEVQLTRIVDEQLDGTLDLVVDDASHQYDLTRRSFEILFPRLSPGGTYVIEDWAWAHSPNMPPQWANNEPLTNLVFDLVMLQGSSRLISEIRVLKPVCVVRKSATATRVPPDFWSDVAVRTRRPNRI